MYKPIVALAALSSLVLAPAFAGEPSQVALMRQASGRATHITLDRMANGAIDACASLVGTSPGCDCSCAIDGRLAGRSR